MTAQALGVTAIILTKNEESCLPGCLDSLQWCDDVRVVDSGSEDSTQDVARAGGAEVYENSFVSFGEQRNWALRHCKDLQEWVLFLDADERSTPQFAAAVLKETSRASDEVAGFYCCWKLMREGQWLRFSGLYPNWQLRLLRRGRADFSDFGHSQKEGEVDGILQYVREPFLHEAFAKGWDDWFHKHLRYAGQEARLRMSSPLRPGLLLSRHGAERNKALKLVLGVLPGGPVIRFLHSYVGRFGFLDGRRGLTHCLNLGIYEYLIRLKVRELKSAGQGPRKPPRPRSTSTQGDSVPLPNRFAHEDAPRSALADQE